MGENIDSKTICRSFGTSIFESFNYPYLNNGYCATKNGLVIFKQYINAWKDPTLKLYSIYEGKQYIKYISGKFCTKRMITNRSIIFINDIINKEG